MSWIKDVLYELSELDLSVKSLRKFSGMVGSILLLIALLFQYQDKYEAVKLILLTFGSTLLIIGLFFPRMLKGIYKLWMGLAFAMGWLMSRIILSLLFVFVITPLGITAKLFNKKFISHNFKEKKDSFWIEKKDSTRNMEKMY